MSGRASDMYLSPDEQDLLVAALNSNQAGPLNTKQSTPPNPNYTPQTGTNPGSGQLDYSDDSPYLDFDPDGEFDDSFGYGGGRMIGDLPDDLNGSTPDLHDKRKSIDGEEDDEEGDHKRHEGDGKAAKKPGRKPLTSEPTTVCAIHHTAPPSPD
jgi:AP-1-like transcription factor